MFHQSSKYSNSSQMYKSRKLSWSERKIRYIYYKLYNDFPEDKWSQSQNRSSNKLEKEQIIFIINKLEEDSTLSSKEISNLIKLEFDLDVRKTTILKCLKSNGYSYKRPKLNLKMKNSKEKWEKICDCVICKIQISMTFSLQMKQASIWITLLEQDG